MKAGKLKRKAKDLYNPDGSEKKAETDSKDINKRLQANETILKYFRRGPAAERALRLSPKKRRPFSEEVIAKEEEEEEQASDFSNEDDKDEDFEIKPKKKYTSSGIKLKEDKVEVKEESDREEEFYDRLPNNKKQLIKLLDKVNEKIRSYKLAFFQEQIDLEGK
jgi:hypothetical protein